jgi:hypothetical protein
MTGRIISFELGCLGSPNVKPKGLTKAGEVVDAQRRIGMLGAEHLFPDRQCALEERSRSRESRPGPEADGRGC